jgi:hypothetical protein
MRHLLRALALAAVLMTNLSRPPSSEAFICKPGHGGSCQLTCGSCFTKSDCPLLDNGAQQACICDYQCP